MGGQWDEVQQPVLPDMLARWSMHIGVHDVVAIVSCQPTEEPGSFNSLQVVRSGILELE
jgi:hypothetical protein